MSTNGTTTSSVPCAAPAVVASGRSLKRRVLLGSGLTLTGFGASQILRIGTSVVMSRLLAPSAFGLMSLVNIFNQGLQMLSDLGVRTSVIQHAQGGDRAFLNTAWTVQIIRGSALWAVAAVVAWPFALLYGQPVLALVIPIASLGLLIGAFGSPVVYLLDRQLRLGRTTICEIGSRVLSIVTMVLWALFITCDVWALVAGALAYSAAIAIMSHLITEHRCRFCWDVEARHFLFRFGVMVLLSSGLLFVANQCERLLLGKHVSLAMLGIYTIALNLSTLPTQMTHKLVASVLFPGYAELLRTNPQRAMVRYGHSLWLTLGLATGISAFFIAIGPRLVESLYDPRWQAASWMLQILSIEAFCEMVQAPSSWLLLASGKPLYGILASALRGLVLLPGLGIALAFGEIRVALWIISLSALVSLFTYSCGVARVHRSLRAKEFCLCLVVTGWALGAVLILR